MYSPKINFISFLSLTLLLSPLYLAQAKADSDISIESIPYGMKSIIGNTVGNPKYDGSTEFKICKHNATASAAVDDCFTDEYQRLNKSINSLVSEILKSPNVPNDKKDDLKNTINMNIHRINYICKVFFIDENGKNNYDGDFPYSSQAACEVWRMNWIKSELTVALGDV